MEDILKRTNEVEPRIYVLSDNRKMSYSDFGVPDGILVLHFHRSSGF